MKHLFKRITTSLFALSLIGAANAQDGLPTKPEDGKCYAKCVTPDKYEPKTEKVEVKPAYKTLKIIPAVYKDAEETIVVKEATKRFKYIPATYKTVYDTVVIEDGYNKLKIDPVQFDAAVRTIETKAKNGKWIAGEKDPECESADPEDCRIFHYREYPAEYEYVPAQDLKKPESTTGTPVKEKIKVVKRQVIDKPARVEEEVIPQETVTVKKRVLVKDETVEEITVPAVYEEVTKQVLVEKGGLTSWKEVPCKLEPIAELIPIYYKLGSAQLTEPSKKIIDERLYTMLQSDPNMRIELGSHTDSRGGASNNMALSQRRAQSVVDYLAAKGINVNRLEAKGYGETKLLNKCADGVTCSEADHQKNRRTEFRILN